MEWLAHVQVNSVDVSRFIKCNIEVSDEQYKIMSKAIKNKQPLKKLDFYEELVNKAKDRIDFMDFVDTDEEPLRSEYDDDEEEEFLEALKEYNEYISSLNDYFFIVRVDIDDPGDLERFKDKFVGREYSGKSEVVLEEDYERIAQYYLDIETSEGKISDISVSAQAMEYDDVRGGSFDECYPDYKWLEAEFEKYLAKRETVK